LDLVVLSCENAPSAICADSNGSALDSNDGLDASWPDINVIHVIALADMIALASADRPSETNVGEGVHYCGRKVDIEFLHRDRPGGGV
jgi:hypothetical protein